MCLLKRIKLRVKVLILIVKDVIVYRRYRGCGVIYIWMNYVGLDNKYFKGNRKGLNIKGFFLSVY